MEFGPRMGKDLHPWVLNYHFLVVIFLPKILHKNNPAEAGCPFGSSLLWTMSVLRPLFVPMTCSSQEKSRSYSC